MDAAAVAEATEPAPREGLGGFVRLAPSGPRHVEATIRMSAPDRSVTRRLRVRRRDCPLLPALVARIWARFLADLPEPRLPRLRSTPGLRPSWPRRRWGWVEVAVSPGALGRPRLGGRIGAAFGTAGRPGWGVELGYDLVPDIPLGSGRAELHAAWAGLGATLEGRLGAVRLLGAAVAGGGVALGRGVGFSRDQVQALPVGRVRLAGRAAWPRLAGGLRPHVAVVLEGAFVGLRLETAGGARYREPILRGEMALGLAWMGTVWGRD
jgi:hypothetical protein